MATRSIANRITHRVSIAPISTSASRNLGHHVGAMAMIFNVIYPSGEIAYAVGYFGTKLLVDIVPPGPESCLYDEIEVDFATPSAVPPKFVGAPCRVLRIIGGPRRPTHRVRVPGGEVVRELWMDARDAEGWSTLDGHDPDPDVVWVVALEDGMDPATLGDLIPR